MAKKQSQRRATRAPAVTADTPIGPDVDLETEEIRLSDGARLTDELAVQIVDEVVAKRTGRPSLSGAAVHSPQIAFRVPSEVREEAERIAKREGKSVSAFAREALEARIAKAR